MKSKNFCILLDKSNPWIHPHAVSFFNKLKLQPSDYIVFDPNETFNFDLCFLLGYTKILSKKELSLDTSYYVIHESDLPKGKGFSPLTWQILEGRSEVDICLIELSEKVDSGKIVLRDKIKFSGYELYEELRLKQAAASFDLIHGFLDLYPEISTDEQSGESTYYKRRTPKDSKLDVDKTIKEQFDLLRVCDNDNWPAFFEINGKEYILKIYRSD